MTPELRDEGVRQDPPEHSVVGGYRLVQQLGEGGMGVVHLALDRHGRAVAMKILRPYIAHDPVARQRLAREVATLERIRDPGVAAVLDADIDGPRPFIVTRYVPGPPLDDVVRDHGPLEPPALVRLARGLADALRAIHAAGVIHRDVKPGNVLILDGDPVLIDFGIAHIADDIRLTSTGLVMGTPGYLSPEVVGGQPVAEATDWWGWAATVAFAALGRPPFGTGPMDVILGRVSRGDPDLTGMAPGLAVLLAAALNPDPASRPDVGSVLTGLEAYAGGSDPTAVLPVGTAAAATAALPTAPPTAHVPSEPLAPRPPTSAPRPASPVRWAGGSPHVDPRIGRPNRSGVLAVLAVALATAAALAPVAAALLVLVLSAVARVADRSVTALVLRRHRNGVRRSDVPVVVASGPWHVVAAVLSAVVAMVLPALVGVSTVLCTALVLRAVRGTGASPLDPVALGVGALVAVWIGWWGPGGSSERRGARSIVRGLTGSPGAAQVLAALLALLAVAAVAILLVRGHSWWWPLTGPPTFGGILPTPVG